MAISKGNLKKGIKAAFMAEKDKEDNLEACLDRIAEALADVVATEIKKGIDTASVTHVLAAPSTGGPVTGKIELAATISE